MTFASDALVPGRSCVISESEWFAFLEAKEPLHQWGGAFLHEESPGGLVRIYVRLDVGRQQWRCVRLDAARSARARQGVEQVEAAARRAADVVTTLQQRGRATTTELAAQERASAAFVEAAEALYRELLIG